MRNKKFRSYKGDISLAALDILECNFKASTPNEKWATNVTGFKLLGQKNYSLPVIDLFNGMITP